MIQMQNDIGTSTLSTTSTPSQISPDAFLEELRELVSQFGSGGGSLTPSVYDTAQVLRFAPPKEGVESGLKWLRENQATDGGWGNPIAPLMRDVPSLAAVLALDENNADGTHTHAIEAGLEFLGKQSGQWQDFSVDDLLVGVELILPTLIDEAAYRKLKISYLPYLKLIQIGKQKRKIIQRLKVIHGTPAAFSWEAWGEFPDRYLVDPLYSVGSSTSATSAWIEKARTYYSSMDFSKSMNFLRRASKATGLDIPGVVPFAWPIDRFEQSFGLYALAIGGLIHHPVLRDAVNSQINQLTAALTPYGMPFTDYFIPDLDDTAATIVAMCKYGIRVNPEILSVFEDGSGYFTYPGEFHASTSAHARAVHALSFLTDQNEDLYPKQEVLFQFQTSEGIWPADKWHKSWFYTTSHMLYALHSIPDTAVVETGLKKLVEGQNADGGWGVNQHSSSAETAYVMLALQLYKKQKPDLEYPYRRGQTWLLDAIYRKPVSQEYLWIGKELFKPYRIDRAFELTALIQGILDPS